MPTDDLTSPSTGRISPFESIKHTDEDGEYWSARELGRLLDYSRWGKFLPVLQKAEEAIRNSGQRVEDHMSRTVQMVAIGSGAQREVEDFQLSRYACYLIVQNADPSKRIVALGQAYFAIKTRKQELAEELLGKTDEQQRILLRDQVAEKNGQLAEAASSAGVVTQRDFAVFQDHGYRGLYTETARQIAARKGLKRGEHILDYMGSEETINNLFRIVQADSLLRREGTSTRDEANAAHFKVGRAVRDTIIGLGGTPPEELPTPEKSVQQLRREEARRMRIEQEDRLGLFARLNAPSAEDEETEDEDEG